MVFNQCACMCNSQVRAGAIRHMLNAHRKHVKLLPRIFALTNVAHGNCTSDDRELASVVIAHSTQLAKHDSVFASVLKSAKKRTLFPTDYNQLATGAHSTSFATSLMEGWIGI